MLAPFAQSIVRILPPSRATRRPAAPRTPDRRSPMPHVMQSATTPLLLFLGRAKRTFLAGPAAAGAGEPRALVYIGNAAGDLDTIVSSLTAAFVREQLPAGDLGAASGAPGAPGAAGAPEAALHVPVLPFARADFRLRQDAALLFAHCGFEMDGQVRPSPKPYSQSHP